MCACVFQHEAPGYFVVQVKATDEDAGQNGIVRYEFVTSASSRPDYQYFDINVTSGVITVAQDVDRELIDQLFVSYNVRLIAEEESRFSILHSWGNYLRDHDCRMAPYSTMNVFA